MPTPQPAPHTLHPALSQPIDPQPQAGAALSPLQFAMAAQCFLFDDGNTLYCYSLNCLKLWTLAPRVRFNGWALGGNDLYYQDGAVTLQFDLNALQQQSGQTPLPSNAFNL